MTSGAIQKGVPTNVCKTETRREAGGEEDGERVQEGEWGHSSGMSEEGSTRGLCKVRPWHTLHMKVPWAYLTLGDGFGEFRRDPEVGHLDGPVRCEEHVGGLDVAVDLLLPVQVLQGQDEFPHDVRNGMLIQGCLFQLS